MSQESSKIVYLTESDIQALIKYTQKTDTAIEVANIHADSEFGKINQRIDQIEMILGLSAAAIFVFAIVKLNGMYESWKNEVARRTQKEYDGRPRSDLSTK